MGIKNRRRIIFRQLLLVFAFIAVSGAVTPPILRWVEERQELLQRRVLQKLEATTGLTFSHQGISPAFLNSIRIKDVKIGYQRDGLDAEVSIRRLKIYYNIFALGGSEPLNAVRSLRLDGVECLITPEIWDALFSAGKSSDAAGSPAAPFFPMSFPDWGMDLRDFHCRFRLPEGTGSLHIERFRGKSVGTDLEGRIEARIEAFPANPEFAISRVESAFSGTGRTGDGGETWSLNLELDRIVSNLFESKGLSLQLDYNRQELRLHKIEDRDPLDLSVVWNREEGEISAEALMESFAPERLFEWKGEDRDIASWLRTELSGGGSMNYRLSTGEFRYEGRLNTRLDNPVLPFPVTVRSDFNGRSDNHSDGREGLLFFNELYLMTARGNLFFRGSLDPWGEVPFLPQGAVKVWDFQLRDKTVTGWMQLQRSGTRLTGEGRDLEWGAIRLRRLNWNAGIDLPNKAVEFSAESEMDTDTGNKITLEGSYQQQGEDSFTAATVGFETVPVDPWIRALTNRGLPGTLKDVALSAEIFLSSDLERVSFSSPEILLEDRHNSDNRLSLLISGNNENIEAILADFSWNGLELTGKSRFDLIAGGGVRFFWDLKLPENRYRFAGYHDPDGGMVIQGDYGLSFSLSREEERSRFSLKSANLPFAFRGESLFLDLNCSGFYKDREEWSLRFNDSALYNLPLPFEENYLRFTAALRPGKALFRNLQYGDRYATLDGAGEIAFQINWQDPGVDDAKGWFYLEDPLKGESFTLSGRWLNEVWEGRFALVRAGLARFPDLALKGYLNAQGSFYGGEGIPDVRMNLSVEEGRWKEKPFELRTGLSISRDDLAFSQLAFSYSGFGISQSRGRLDFAAGDYSMTGSLTASGEILPVQSDWELNGSSDRFSGLSALSRWREKDFEAVLGFRNFSVRNEVQEPWEARLEKVEAEYLFRGGPGMALQGSFREEGDFSFTLAAPSPLLCRGRGSFRDGDIDLQLSEIFYRFDNLEAGAMAFHSGTLEGALALRGPLGDPDFYGRLALKQGRGNAPILLDDFGPINTALLFNGKEVTVPAVTVPFEEGSGIFQGTLQIDRWTPGYYDLRMTIDKGEGLYFDFYKKRKSLYLNGKGYGSVRIYGDLNVMYIDGDVTAPEGYIMINDTLPDRGSSLFTDFFRTTMTITSGKNVAFYWPTRELPVVSTFFDPEQTISFVYDNINDTLDIRGGFSARGGEIFYFQRNFYINEAELVFKPGLRQLDPLFSARAVLREVSSDGELIKIFLIAEEAPITEFSPRFESVPAKTDAEIIAMLGGNFVEFLSGSGNVDLTSALLLTSDIIGQSLLKNFETDIKNVLGLDMFSLRTQLISNVLRDRLVSDQSAAVSPGDQIARYLDNTTLFAGKYFGNTVYAQAMMQMDLYNENLDLPGSVLDFGDFKIDTEISLEWDTPVAAVKVSFYPDFFDPLEGLKDTSLGLSWRFSY